MIIKIYDEIDMRTTKSKERSTSARHNERIGKIAFKSSNSWKSIRVGKINNTNMDTTRDRDYSINGDKGASSYEDTKKKSHREFNTNTVHRETDKNHPFDMLPSSSENGELGQKEITSKDRTTIDLCGDGNNKINVLKRKAHVTNTAQHDGKNIEYSALQHYDGPDFITNLNTP